MPQLYELIKFNKQYIYNQNIPHATCLCKICKNAVFYMQSVNQSFPKELNLQSILHDIFQKISCNSDCPDCVNSKFKECELPEKIDESETDKQTALETDNITFNKWKQVNCRAQKVSVSIDIKEVSPRFNTHVKTLKHHIHVKRIQHATFYNLKSNLKERKEILI